MVYSIEKSIHRVRNIYVWGNIFRFRHPAENYPMNTNFSKIRLKYQIIILTPGLLQIYLHIN